ncbi:MAG: hypothetical protein AB7T63_03355 [Planctomycetota bacterium]
MTRLLALLVAAGLVTGLAACSGGPSLPDPLGLFSGGGSADPAPPRDTTPYTPPEAPSYTPPGGAYEPSYTPPSYDSGYGYSDPGYTDPGYTTPTYPDPGYPAPSYQDPYGGSYPAPAPAPAPSGGGACGAGGKACG